MNKRSANRIKLPDGEVYVAVPLLIHTHDYKNGQPKLCTMLDPARVDLEGSEEIILAYVPEDKLKGQKGKK